MFLIAKEIKCIFYSVNTTLKKIIKRRNVADQNKNAFKILHLAVLPALLFLNPCVKLSESVLEYGDADVASDPFS